MTANKILIIAPAWVGDMVMAQALFKLLKQRMPTVTIDVLALPWAQSLLARMPEVNNILTMPLGHGQLQLYQRWQLGRSLRAAAYQQAIVLPNSWKSALVSFAANIPQRTGWLGEFRFGLLNDVRYLDKKQLPLMAQRFLALGQARHCEELATKQSGHSSLRAKRGNPGHSGLLRRKLLAMTVPPEIATDIINDYLNYRPQLHVSADSIASALKKFALMQLEQPVLALCPGAEYGPAKRWPTEYYAKLAQAKLAAGWQVWLFGGSKDQPIAQEIQQATAQACVDLTGRTSLGEAIDLLSLATKVVSNDSGLMHIAAALQRPLVVIYGSSSPRFTPPLCDNVKILSLGLPCSPCFQRECPLDHLKCLRDLSPDLVLHAMDSLN